MPDAPPPETPEPAASEPRENLEPQETIESLSRFSDELREKVREVAQAPMNVEELAAAVGVSHEDHDAFEDWLESLARQGFLERVKRRRFRKPEGKVIVGVFRRAKWGAYVKPESAEMAPVDIPEAYTAGAQDGDRVAVSWRRERPGRKFRGKSRVHLAEAGTQGRVLGILDARPTEAVGVFEFDHRGNGRVRLEGYALPHFVWLAEHEVRHLKPGTLVKVRLMRKPDSRGRTRAEVLGALGTLRNPLDDLENIVALYDFPGPFSEEALAQAKALPKDPDPSDFHGRVDLRALPIITIDPKDAQDHDDAISIEPLPGGLVRLGVHIADVGRYVTPDSPLDRDARDRATSVYLPGRIIPMLPEELSHGLCSLHDSVDRLAKSCFLVYDASGRVLRREVANSVIRVRRYLTYEEVLPVLLGEATTNDEVVDGLLKEAGKLADVLHRERLKGGALVLDIQRPHVIVDRNGLVQSIEPEKHDIAHNLIEEFMLAANRAVARFLLERGLPYIGRVHPAPTEEAREAFGELCDELKVARPDFDEPCALQRMLDALHGREGAEAIHFALLRSMKRATYAPEPRIHYALQWMEYVHFTSPIRRYPDTVVHQVLDAYLKAGGVLRRELKPLDLPWADGSTGAPEKTKNDGRRIPRGRAFELLMPGIADHCTDRSIRADKGELAADQVKILRTLEGRIGEEIKGTVIAVTGMGAVIQLDGTLAEGLINFRDLTDGWVETHRYWAHYEKPSGVGRIMMGDRVEAEISEIDLGSRTMRLTPLGEFTRARNGQTPRWHRHAGRGRQSPRPRGKGRKGRR